MTGPEHFAEAERLLRQSSSVSLHDGHAQLLAAQAQVHATLALASATALAATDKYIGDSDQVTEWAHCIQPHPPL